MAAADRSTGELGRPLQLGDVITALETRYQPRWAADWDAVGLVCGDAAAEVSSVLFAVDPVAAVVDEAVASGVDLLVTHHPLFLTAVHGVPASDAKGRLVHSLIRAGCALYVAHTNADVAAPGVSDALAAAIGLTAARPLVREPDDPLDTVVTFVSRDAVDQLIDALAAAGAGDLGDYRRCAFSADGHGTFTPQPGARPTIGSIGTVEQVTETRVEMVLPRHRRSAVVAALRAAHPYEEPAFSVLELAAGVPTGRGSGRIGTLERPERLRDFAARVARALPSTSVGVRATGDPDRWVETIAVCGGSGGSYVEDARRSGADAYVTADLRHHPASEAMEPAGDAGDDARMALLDVTHWASEWPFLPYAAELLEQDLAASGDTVSTRVSTLVTDPWTLHAPSPDHGTTSTA